MLMAFVNGAGNVILRVKIRSTTAPYGGLTGLSSASSGMSISTIADNEATATAYTVAASNVETITTLGTFAAPTSGKCRFREVDATNHPGLYEIQIATARYGVTAAKSLLVTVSGASGMAECDALIPLWSLNPYNGTNASLTALPAFDAATSGGLPTVGTSSGQITLALGRVTVGSMVADSVTASALATDAVTEIAGGIWNAARSSYTTAGSFGECVNADTVRISGDATAADNLEAALDGTGGVTITAALTGNVTGNLSGSVGSVSGNVGGNVTGSVGSVVGAVGSVTGNVGGNVTGSVGSVASGGITASSLATGTITAAKFAAGAIDAAAIATGAIDADALASDAGTEIATAVWSTSVPGSFTSGQAGNVLGNVATGTPPTASAIADAVWDEARSGHTTAGTFGQYVLARDDSGSALPTASGIATQVWSTAVPGSFTSGQAGEVLGNIATGTPPTAAAIADAVWDEARSGHTTAGTFGEYVLATNTAGAALATASALSTVDTNVSAILDDTGTTGVVVASGSKTGYSLSSSQTFNLTGNITGNLSGSVGSVSGAVGSVAGNVGGNVTGSVGSIASGGIASTSFASGAITADAIAADAIGSSELAASAVTEIAAGVLTTALTESYAADGSAPTLTQAIFMTMQGLTEFAISGTTLTVKRLDGSTTAATFTLDSSTSPTSRTRAS